MLRLLVLGLLVACNRSTPAPSGLASASSSPAAAPPPVLPSASVVPVASAVPPAPTALRSIGMQCDSPGRKPLPITLLRTEPDAGSALLNEETGELLAFREKDEGAAIQLKGPLFAARMALPEEKKAGTLQIDGGPAIRLQMRPPEPTHAKVGSNGPPPEEEQFLGADGVEIKVTAEDFAEVFLEHQRPPRFLIHRKPGGARRPEILHKNRWVPSTNRRFSPKRVVLGATVLQPERLGPDGALGCLVHGVVPAIDGSLGEAVKAAWRGWARSRCSEAGKDAVVELTYSTVLLAGVNLPDYEPRAVNDPPRTGSSAPSSSVHMPINLQARVTSAAGIVVVEEALLLDTKAGTMERLTPMATPKMAEVLRDWSSYGLSAPSWFPRKALTWPLQEPLAGSTPATLAVGPSTINVVLPTAPLGLFLPSRHLAIGPRSTFAVAFTPSAATRRLTAALFVDY